MQKQSFEKLRSIDWKTNAMVSYFSQNYKGKGATSWSVTKYNLLNFDETI